MKAVILAGGFGKRLRPLTDSTPKPLIEVGGKPILEWQIEWLKKYGYDSFIVPSSYLAEKIIDFFGQNSKRLKISAEVVIEKEPLGTGGALKNVEHLLKGEREFLMVNGDNITNLNVGNIKLGKNIASLALTPLPSPYGIIDVKDDSIVSFVEKPLLKDYWINAGVYKMANKVFGYLPQNGAIENTTFPELVRLGLLGGTKFSDCYWRGTDTIKDFEEVNKDLGRSNIYG